MSEDENKIAINMKNMPKLNSTAKLLIIGIVLITVTFLLNKLVEIQSRKALIGDKSTVEQNSQSAENELRARMQEAQKEMGDDFYSKASNDAPIPQDGMQNPMSPETNAAALKQIPGRTPISKAQAAEKYVTLKVVNFGKANPFEPYIDVAFSSSNPMYDLPAPPTTLTEDPSATNLLKTTISGIMYDPFAPSAIVSVEGQDHVVRKGDRINGYRILNITKDRVVVQNGTNVYRATVGETLVANSSNVNFNDVYNLPNKFGGSRARNTRMIYMNSLN